MTAVLHHQARRKTAARAPRRRRDRLVTAVTRRRRGGRVRVSRGSLGAPVGGAVRGDGAGGGAQRGGLRALLRRRHHAGVPQWAIAAASLLGRRQHAGVRRWDSRRLSREAPRVAQLRAGSGEACAAASPPALVRGPLRGPGPCAVPRQAREPGRRRALSCAAPEMRDAGHLREARQSRRAASEPAVGASRVRAGLLGCRRWGRAGLLARCLHTPAVPSHSSSTCAPPPHRPAPTAQAP